MATIEARQTGTLWLDSAPLGSTAAGAQRRELAPGNYTLTLRDPSGQVLATKEITVLTGTTPYYVLGIPR